MIKKFIFLFDAKLWKFLLVGVLNTVVGNGLMFLLYNLFGLGYWPSTAISYVLASIMSYFLNRYFTFKYQGNGWMAVLRFALNIAVCYALAYGIAQPLMKLILTDAAQTLRDNVAMFTGMCLFVVFNYFGQRFFAFREDSKKDTKS